MYDDDGPSITYTLREIKVGEPVPCGSIFRGTIQKKEFAGYTDVHPLIDEATYASVTYAIYEVPA